MSLNLLMVNIKPERLQVITKTSKGISKLHREILYVHLVSIKDIKEFVGVLLFAVFLFFKSNHNPPLSLPAYKIVLNGIVLSNLS